MSNWTPLLVARDSLIVPAPLSASARQKGRHQDLICNRRCHNSGLCSNKWRCTSIPLCPCHFGRAAMKSVFDRLPSPISQGLCTVTQSIGRSTKSRILPNPAIPNYITLLTILKILIDKLLRHKKRSDWPIRSHFHSSNLYLDLERESRPAALKRLSKNCLVGSQMSTIVQSEGWKRWKIICLTKTSSYSREQISRIVQFRLLFYEERVKSLGWREDQS